MTTFPTQLFIDGLWQDSHDGGTFAVHDPSTGTEIARVASATVLDAGRALDAAVAAADDWAATPPRERGEILRRAFELVVERREEFAALITLEMGKPLAESRAEVTYGAEFLRWFSEEAVRIAGRYTTAPEGTGTIVVSHSPVGPCLLITPWNFPLAMATRKVGPALAAGCTVVIKPAEATPLTTLLFAQVLVDAGVPHGVVNVITTANSREASARIIADPRLRKLSFTGSTSVGIALMKQAADGVLRTSMELGGNAPFLVFEDADLDAAVSGALAAKFRNVGQACTAANRFIVHESVARQFADLLRDRVASFSVGPGSEPGIDIGPLIGDHAVDEIIGMVDDAVARGAVLLTGGTRLEGKGSFLSPAVVSDVPRTARLWTEEIFGPILAISTFATEAEAIALANDTQYGLASYAYTRDVARVQRLISGVRSGMLGINSGVISNAAAPFGGVGHSGIGREGGSEGIAEYLDTKYTFIPSES